MSLKAASQLPVVTLEGLHGESHSSFNHGNRIPLVHVTAAP
jgi:hypothetical protein